MKSAARAVSSSLPKEMRAITINAAKGGKPEALEVSTLPVPELKVGEVLIKVKNAGVNRPDVLQRMGRYPPPPGHSPIPGLEVSGVVVDKHDSVASFGIGSEVCALTNGGGYAEYVSVPATQCLTLPWKSEFQKSSSLPETFFTVWHNLFQQCNTFGRKLIPNQPGSSILVHGGSSGIGTTAIQVATALGVDVFATAGTVDKCTACEQLGAKKAFNYKEMRQVDGGGEEPAWVEGVLDETKGEGVDVVLDMVSGPYIDYDFRVLKTEGRLAIIGSLGGKTPTLSFLPIVRKRLTVNGSTIRARTPEVKASIAKDLQEQVWPLLSAGKINIPIDSTFSLENASKAHERMESSAHIGKIVLNVS